MHYVKALKTQKSTRVDKKDAETNVDGDARISSLKRGKYEENLFSGILCFLY